MAKCERCGEQTGAGRKVCTECRRDWLANRNSAIDQAESELGPLCAANHPAIVKRVKELEREMA